MAFDAELTERMRLAIGDRDGISEKRMMGGEEDSRVAIHLRQPEQAKPVASRNVVWAGLAHS